MIKEKEIENFIKKHNLRKSDGCFNINKAIELEKILLEVKEKNDYKLEILKVLLGEKNEN